MNKIFIALMSIAFCLNIAYSQVDSLAVEVVKIHDGIEIPSLNGYTTYRLYAYFAT